MSSTTLTSPTNPEEPDEHGLDARTLLMVQRTIDRSVLACAVQLGAMVSSGRVPAPALTSHLRIAGHKRLARVLEAHLENSSREDQP